VIQKKAIIIAGPTASGKTALAIETAVRLGTEIISADSRQCFRELNIGVARPTEEELHKVKHHFIASHSIHEKVTAITFEQYALEKAKEIFRDHDYLVMAGGTGLYIDAFCEGMDEIPEVPEVIHQEINYEYSQKGLDWLQQQVQQLDPAFYAVGEIQNPQRLLRALEVFKSTGKSILQFRKGEKKQRNFQIEKIFLQLPKEELRRRIDMRVDRMMEAGLLHEVQSLVPYQHLNALQTVGYRELLDHLNGEISLPEAIARIKINTRQYAKRQMTWFKRSFMNNDGKGKAASI
jgi:tRNA dimethylallyltransferase